MTDRLNWLGSRFDARLVRWFTVGAVGLVVAIGAWQIYLEQSFIRFVARHDTLGGYGAVVGPLLETASAADEAAEEGAEILVLADGDDPMWDNLPSAFDVLLPHALGRVLGSLRDVQLPGNHQRAAAGRRRQSGCRFCGRWADRSTVAAS